MHHKESVGGKVHEADMERVPYVIVVGDEEVASRKLTVTVRKKSLPNKLFKEQMTVDALIVAVRKDVEGEPFRPLYTPPKLSMKEGISEKNSIFYLS
jgi:threonyl-tRNA synthetase